MRIVCYSLLILLSKTLVAQDHNYTFVFLNKNPNAEQISKEESEKIMEGHMANINDLAGQGKLLAAGPFDGGGGIFILNTKSVDEAQGWLSADPGVKANRWIIEYLPYHPRTGGVCPVSAPYEMVSYFFIRYTALVTKFNAGTYPALIEQHLRYLKESGIATSAVTEAYFDKEGSSILILKDEVPMNSLESDPAVHEGLLTIEIKKLYIARGSFCEQ